MPPLDIWRTEIDQLYILCSPNSWIYDCDVDQPIREKLTAPLICIR